MLSENGGSTHPKALPVRPPGHCACVLDTQSPVVISHKQRKPQVHLVSKLKNFSKLCFFSPLNKKYLQDFLYFSRQFLIQKQAHVDQTVTGNGGRLLTYKTVTGTGRRLLTYKTHGQEKETEQEEHGDASATWPSVWDNHIHLETV